MAFIGRISLMIVVMFVHGLSLSILWGWFIAPKFKAPTLGIVEAMGISLIVGILTAQYIPNDENSEEFCLNGLLHNLTVPIIGLLTGWILHFFM